MRQTQTAADIAAAIAAALADGKRLHILYLDTPLVITPLSLASGILTTWADSMNRARQFRTEFIREAIVLEADSPQA